MSDDIVINPGSGGDTVAADDIGGKKHQRIKVVIGDDGVSNGDVSAANPIPAILKAASPATTVIGTVQQQAITKGAQGTLGVTTQDLKDAGRVIVNAATAIAGVALVNVEAMLALDVSRDFAVTGSLTTIPVTAGKRYRITGIIAGVILSGAAVRSTKVSLRVNPAGAAIVTSPIAFTITIGSDPAVAQQGKTIHFPIPDGMELSGTMQAGLSHVSDTAAGGNVWAALVGFEY